MTEKILAWIKERKERLPQSHRAKCLFILKSISPVFTNDWKCVDVKALLEVEAFNIDPFNQQIHLEYQFTECSECNLLYLSSLQPDPKNASRFIAYGEFDPNFSYQIQISQKNRQNQTERIFCPKFTYDQFDECGVYRISIDDKSNCSVINTVKPNNIYRVLYYGIPLILVILIGMNLIEKYYDRLKTILTRSRTEPKEEINLDCGKKVAKKKERFDSIDTFRGLSIIVMIFNQYGWGTFFYHCAWSGLNLSAFVFPWFLFIMGVSVPISMNSMLAKPDSKRLKIFYRIAYRSFKMFLIGFILVSSFDFKISEARIFGVLQRISICYFVIATLELVFWKPMDSIPETNNWKKYFRDLIFAIPHFVFIHLLILVWFLIVYLLPVPGCPTGYLGPGGNEYGGKYFNCSGGATGYIDKVILGYGHLYSELVISQKVYQIDRYEPEGIWGTLPSICLAYYGVVAGRILLFYKDPKKRLIYWSVWALITFLLFGVLCQFDLKNGWLPVTKNIWTYSFTLVTASSSFLIQAFFYILIEYKKLWTGAPFRHVGLNSIFIYICQSVFWFRFPVQWKVEWKHEEKFLQCIWGSFVWIMVSVYMYRKKIFINI
ncbi:heparan-alpha-glucosaminide N-acetyltransferase isoform X2 [Brachionus plicatilis]|uniref:Heparan-alpha-glucosaminide N-acetyltransferase isoform X2 n=1 Tax=Brachionus plicatilis TaxID=10195 RepID=A0A3M7Q536_BRAPC|nr:heparan-alpha-glucosaminide N-acetyltransferase isoform X2 [Brachionus plicatilis]